MSGADHSNTSDFVARHLARRGAEAIEQMQHVVDEARRMMASGKIAPYEEGEDVLDRPPHDWEVSEAPVGKLRRIYVASVSEAATGQGITLHFVVGLARDEDDFRSQLKPHLGSVLANGAKVAPGLGGSVYVETFVSTRLAAILDIFDQAREAPAAFLFKAQWHENRA